MRLTPRSFLITFTSVEADTRGENPGDTRPCWAALADVLRNEGVPPWFDALAAESEIEAHILATKRSATLVWDGSQLNLLHNDPVFPDVTLYSMPAIRGLIDIRPGYIRVGEREYEILGTALDAVTLADLFVQLFALDQRQTLRALAVQAEVKGLKKEAFAIFIATDLWRTVEDRYEMAREINQFKNKEDK